MARYRLADERPRIQDTCFTAPNSSIIGDVVIGNDSSVWPFASIRADSDKIRIGERTSVQDNAVLHTADGYPVTVGDSVTVGHQAVVHGCRVSDECLIGMGARVLSGAEIGKHVIVAAGALVTENATIPERSMVMGVPGKVVRELTDEEVERIRENAQVYVEKTERYRTGFHRAKA